MTAAGKPCPVPGCEGIQKPARLMCLAHWRRVPKPLRDAVWETWRALNEAPVIDSRFQTDKDRRDEFFARRRAYRYAADQAVKAVSPPSKGD